MNKGFVTITTAIIIFLATTVVAGGGFGAYKYNEAIKEKEQIQQELLAQKDLEIQRLKQETELEVVTESATSTPEQNEEKSTDVLVTENVSEPEVVETVRTVIEYVPVEVPAEKVDDVNNEAEQEAVEESAKKEDIEDEVVVNEIIASTDATFDILAVRQTAFPDGYGGVYGGYEIEIRVTAPENSDVYIPQTTTNTIGASIIGFSYTVTDESFHGIEDSRVSCSIKRDNNCRIKAGQSYDVTTTIWLYPDSESNGNYALTFNDLYYMVGGEWKTHSLNRTTARINLMY